MLLEPSWVVVQPLLEAPPRVAQWALLLLLLLLLPAAAIPPLPQCELRIRDRDSSSASHEALHLKALVALHAAAWRPHC